MLIPFQAVEVYLDNVVPLADSKYNQYDTFFYNMHRNVDEGMRK